MGIVRQCTDEKCVNWRCTGTRHMDFEGRKWGTGWTKRSTRKRKGV